MLNLMYITNRPEIARIAEESGVDRIFIDMEYIGKSDRQGGMDTVQSHHTVEDIRELRKYLKNSKLMVRCNPLHSATSEYGSSKEEIDAIIESGADLVMLPYFKTVKEVETFIRFVDGKAQTLPLVETPEAVACIDEILHLDGLDEIFIGLNDLSLGYGKKFMFELLTDGTLDTLCEKFRTKRLPYGFGGIAALGKGLLPSELVIAEHYRLGSTCAILSRSFCNTNVIKELDTVSLIFDKGLKDIRAFEKDCENGRVDFIKNRKQVEYITQKIVADIEKGL